MAGVIVAEALRAAAGRLAATSDTGRLDAELLMAHALGTSRSELLLRRMADGVPAAFPALVERRAAHEPVAYITGQQEFYGLDLAVTPAVLIPRADSETLVEAARRAFEGRAPPRRVLDLGTGSGALLLAALSLWPEAEGHGIDRDASACIVAQCNAERVGVNLPRRSEDLAGGLDRRGPELPHGAVAHVDRARFSQRDWTQPQWRAGLGRFDLVLANPPYVETTADLAPSVRGYEPAGALFAGSEGMDDYHRLLPQLPDLLEPGGCVVLEIGATQEATVAALAQAAGFTARTARDLAGRPRALVLANKAWQSSGE